jgi:hypothetical protein
MDKDNQSSRRRLIIDRLLGRRRETSERRNQSTFKSDGSATKNPAVPLEQIEKRSANGRNRIDLWGRAFRKLEEEPEDLKLLNAFKKYLLAPRSM